MNNTQSEIVAVVFGFTFSIPNADSLFLDYIAPIILQENSSPTIPFLIALLYAILFFASFSGVILIVKNVKRVWCLSKSQQEFDRYMIKNTLILFTSFIIALFFKIRLGL